MNRTLIALVFAATLGACASRGPDPTDQAGAAIPAFTAARAQALTVPADMSDNAFASWLASERARIAHERSAAGQRFDAAEKTCWHRFAVNDCMRQARAERRAVIDALRQQDLSLNAHERQRRADERLRGLGLKAAEDRVP